MIIGFFQPILILPENEYSAEELFFILKHELVHLKRHDVYFKLLLLVATALHWLNPIIHLMQKEAAVDMELSCDERVIQDTAYDVRKAYTEALASALHKQYRKKNILSTQFYGRWQGVPLQNRIPVSHYLQQIKPKIILHLFHQKHYRQIFKSLAVWKTGETLYRQTDRK